MSANNASFSLILYEFNFCVDARYVAPRIIVQHNSSACTKAELSFKETLVLFYLEFNLSKLYFISILGTHIACELINLYCAIATFINLSLVQ